MTTKPKMESRKSQMPQNGRIEKPQVKGVSVQSKNRQIRPETRPGSLMTLRSLVQIQPPRANATVGWKIVPLTCFCAVVLNSFALGRMRAESFRNNSLPILCLCG